MEKNPDVERAFDHFSDMHSLILFNVGKQIKNDGLHKYDLIKDGRLVDWWPFYLYINKGPVTPKSKITKTMGVVTFYLFFICCERYCSWRQVDWQDIREVYTLLSELLSLGLNLDPAIL